jgi:hypothetical protein
MVDAVSNLINMKVERSVILRRESPMSQNRDEGSNVKPPGEKGDFALRVLTVVIAAGLVGILVYAIQGIAAGGWAEFFSIVSVGLMVAGAVLVAGILIGFLFGLPRYLKQRGSEPGSAAENPTEGELPKYETNLSAAFYLVICGRAFIYQPHCQLLISCKNCSGKKETRSCKRGGRRRSCLKILASRSVR